MRISEKRYLINCNQIISISFIFKIPDSSGVGYVPETYLFAFILAMFVLGVSAIVSAILYVGRKRKE